MSGTWAPHPSSRGTQHQDGFDRHLLYQHSYEAFVKCLLGSHKSSGTPNSWIQLLPCPQHNQQPTLVRSDALHGTEPGLGYLCWPEVAEERLLASLTGVTRIQTHESTKES